MATTTITLTIQDAQLTRVINALCASAGLAPTGANAKEALRQMVTRIVIGYDQALANQAAIDAVASPSDPGIT